jgi:hypothetical protein
MNYWQSKNEVIIGDIGEDIVETLFPNFIVYRTNSNGSHPVDMLICSGKKPDYYDKLLFVEVKTKPRRYKYADTGVDIHSWKRYVNFIDEHKINIKIYFVDEAEKSIYSINIRKTLKNETYYTNNKDKIVYFQLKDTKFIRKLSEVELKTIQDKRIELKYPIPSLDKYKNFDKFFK